MSSDTKTFEHWLRAEKGYSISTAQLYASSARIGKPVKETKTIGGSMVNWLHGRAQKLYQEWKGAPQPTAETTSVPANTELKHTFTLDGDTAIFVIESKGQKYEVLIDADSVQSLLSHRWGISHRKVGKNLYAYILRRENETGERHPVFLHREVMQTKDGTQTVFLNKNTLDCRRSNLASGYPLGPPTSRAPIKSRPKHNWKYKDRVYISKLALIRAEKLPELKSRTVSKRLEMGWSLDQALSTPMHKVGRPRKPDLEET